MTTLLQNIAFKRFGAKIIRNPVFQLAYTSSIELLEKEKEEEDEKDRIRTIEPECGEGLNGDSIEAENNRSRPIKSDEAVKARLYMVQQRDREVQAEREKMRNESLSAGTTAFGQIRAAAAVRPMVDHPFQPLQPIQSEAAIAALRQVSDHRILAAPNVAIPVANNMEYRAQ